MTCQIDFPDTLLGKSEVAEVVEPLGEPIRNAGTSDAGDDGTLVLS
jgi:hypothetical protein